MQRHGWLLVALLAVATSTTAQSVTLTLAIVRPDGQLVPFAAYDNGNWEQAWPSVGEAGGEPTFENTPSVWRRRGESVPKLWHVWPSAGNGPIQAHVTGVEAVEAHCESQVALTTDLRPVVAPHPLKLGVATDADYPLADIEAVQPSDAMWRLAARAVAARFSALEAQRAQSDRVQLPRETPAPAVRITELYRESNSSRSPLYFVADKSYRTARSPSDPQCAARTIMTGWLMRVDHDRLTVHESRIFLTDCDGKGARTALPLAALYVSGRLFWVLQEHGYEDESYVVAEIAPPGVRYAVTVNGGGC